MGAPPPNDGQEQRPLFEHVHSGDSGTDVIHNKLYMYYFPPKTAWVISPTVGGENIFAYGVGDVAHPTLLCSFWNLKEEGGGFNIDIDIDVDVAHSGIFTRWMPTYMVL